MNNTRGEGKHAGSEKPRGHKEEHRKKKKRGGGGGGGRSHIWQCSATSTELEKTENLHLLYLISSVLHSF